jgi:hypothetical protein
MFIPAYRQSSVSLLRFSLNWNENVLIREFVHTMNAFNCSHLEIFMDQKKEWIAGGLALLDALAISS